MILLYVHQTRIGPFYIGYANGHFHPVYNSQSLGAYPNAQMAVDDLWGGHTYSIENGIDTAKLGIPPDLGDWDRLSA